MQAVEQWRVIEKNLPEGWEEARLTFTVEDEASADAAAEVSRRSAPVGSGESCDSTCDARVPHGPESVRNLAQRLDRRRIWGSLEGLSTFGSRRLLSRQLLLRVGRRLRPRELLQTHGTMRLRTPPPDWSDLLRELEVDSSDYLPRAALLGAP